jgi:ketosteroid isomerase-like protein
MKLKNGKTADRGKYIVVWKRDGGQWRLHRDSWNTSMPAK